jgi:CRISPR-associated protein Csx10
MTTTAPNSHAVSPLAVRTEWLLESPLCLADGTPADNLTRTLDYIPGSTVRGTLAQHYLASGAKPDAAFERLFVGGEVTYGNLYPNGGTPIPLSAHSCKYRGGFPADGRHGVADLLLPRLLDQQTGKASAPPQAEVCEDCGAPLSPYSGYLDHRGRTVPIDRLRRVLTRSATDDRLQTAQAGLLYSIEILDPDDALPFAGDILCADPELAEQVRHRLLDPLLEDPDARLHIGTARSRGLGEVSLAPYPTPAPTPLAPLQNRLARLNQRLTDHAADPRRFYFTVTLRADAIVEDSDFVLRPIPTPDLLAHEAAIPLDTAQAITFHTAFTGSRRVNGWNAALRAPKTPVDAIRAGSAFLYSAPADQADTLTAALARLEALGMGLRRTEGFGRLTICDPFHLDQQRR